MLVRGEMTLSGRQEGPGSSRSNDLGATRGEKFCVLSLLFGFGRQRDDIPLVSCRGLSWSADGCFFLGVATAVFGDDCQCLPILAFLKFFRGGFSLVEEMSVGSRKWGDSESRHIWMKLIVNLSGWSHG